MDFDYEMYEVGDQKWGIKNNVSFLSPKLALFCFKFLIYK